MSYEINPCNAVINKITKSPGDNNINIINNDCYSICKDFGDVYGNDVEVPCKKMCAEMVSRKKNDMGYTDCNFRRPVPPPGWNQVSAYFPRLLMAGETPSNAYKKCCSMCEDDNLPNSCKDKCKMDADSVVYVKKDKPIENYIFNGGKNATVPKNITTSEISGGTIFLIVLLICAIVLFTILYVTSH